MHKTKVKGLYTFHGYIQVVSETGDQTLPTSPTFIAKWKKKECLTNLACFLNDKILTPFGLL